MPELKANGTTLHYDDAGSGAAIVLTHGFADSGLLWQPQIDHFQDRYRIVTHDIRGHARSGVPYDVGVYTQDQVVEDVRAIMDHLGIEKAVVGGHSLGGYTSLRFYDRYPDRVRGLILSGTGPGYRRQSGKQGWTETNERDAARYKERGLDTVIDARADNIGRHGGDVPISHTLRGLAYVRRGVMRMPPLAELSEIAVPAIVLVGDQDTPFQNSSEYMVAKIPNASGPVVVPDASHWCNFDQPAIWNEAVGEFLASLPA
jgi:pimeloyl-ACP methyl ester carboxylesterase